jgi:hypothetical protein
LFVVYAIGIVCSVEFAWGLDRHHLVFLVIFLLGTICLSYAALEPRYAFWSSIAAVLVAVGIYFFAPAYTLQEMEAVNYLHPANEPMPDNQCGASDDAMKFIAGSNVLYRRSPGVITVIRVGQCDALKFDKTNDGIAIEGSLYDVQGKAIAWLSKDAASDKIEVHSFSGGNFVTTHGSDLSTLIVSDTDDNELLYVRYLNPTTVRFRGSARPPSSSA